MRLEKQIFRREGKLKTEGIEQENLSLGRQEDSHCPCRRRLAGRRSKGRRVAKRAALRKTGPRPKPKVPPAYSFYQSAQSTAWLQDQ